MHTLLAEARAQGRASLSEVAGKNLLSKFHVTVPRFFVAKTAADVDDLTLDLVPPFVVKVMSQDILHKSDVGGVTLGLPDVEAVRSAIRSMGSRAGIKNARVEGYLIEEMSDAGCEVVVGAVVDKQFGPMLMVGIGGVLVEVLRDVAFRLCPITFRDAIEMLAELRGAKLLDGVRGSAPANKGALIQLLLDIGGENGLVSATVGEIAELDINPVIVTARTAIAVDARVILTNGYVKNLEPTDGDSDQWSITEHFAPLFSPKTVAVLGASASSTAIGNTFIRRLRAFGYAGQVFPIHPKASEIEGLRCYPSLAAAPAVVDYAYIAIGAHAVAAALEGAEGRVRFAQVLSSGFGEVAEGAHLQQQLIAKARAISCRVIGPNCIGTYSPRGRLTFPEGASSVLGSVGVVSQSGGLGTDIIKRGQQRGLRFSGLVTVGNSADVGPAEIVEFYLADAQTKVIGLYLEDIKEGRKFFELLRDTRPGKPVVVLRGGRSSQGHTAAASHTGALAGDSRAWEAMSKQTGCVMVDTITQFIDVLLAFQCLDPHHMKPVQSVVLFGNGGGTSVLATDSFADHGLDVLPFDTATQEKLDALSLPPGTSTVNPIDAPVATLQQDEGRVASLILDVVCESSPPDALVMHLNLASFVGRSGINPIDNILRAAAHVRKTYHPHTHLLLVLRVDGSLELEERRRQYRARAIDYGIPVFDELENAADALRALKFFELHRTVSMLDDADDVGVHAGIHAEYRPTS